MKTNPLNKQIGGDHYKNLGIQPWEYIHANNLGFFEGNVVKYVTRDKDNKLQDLQKAKHILEFMISNLEQNAN